MTNIYDSSLVEREIESKQVEREREREINCLDKTVCNVNMTKWKSILICFISSLLILSQPWDNIQLQR